MTKKLILEPFDVRHSDVMVNSGDLRRDLHIYIDYIRHRQVKRAYRSNELPKADSKRILKLMGRVEDIGAVNQNRDSAWLDYVEQLALALGWVHYDTEGVYVGYSSQSPSFPDNYIEFEQERYEQFLAKSPREQEMSLLETMIRLGAKGRRKYAYHDLNEFYEQSVLGRLDSFSTAGSAMGIMPSLDFPKIRRFLFDLLARCEADAWFSTASLIAYLKANHPYFLIPKNLKSDRWGRKTARYGNFRESKELHGYSREPIPDDAPDGFERVEGRYVERFLEGIPLTLGYVDVAYAKKRRGGYPSRGMLQAFRVHPRFLHLMAGELAAPKVTVQPNFEVHVEAEFYPVRVLNQLLPFTKVLTMDRVIVLKLDRQTTAAALAEDDNLDPIATLQRLTARPLPQNVRIELEEWMGHADVFTLYNGFALWEGRKQARMAGFTVEEISPNLRIVRSADKLFRGLEQAELAPLAIEHGKDALKPLPAAAKTLFPKQDRRRTAKRKTKKRITLQRETHTTLHLPGTEVLDRLSVLLAEQRCLFTSDKHSLTITYAQRYEDQVKAAIKALRQDYTVRIEDVKSA
ncbi:MAG TPA: hypothetical protein G4N94_01985 [Caldilineae bacterium]|nr:hypothetical protein [Caldilineae bacterium]